MGEGKGYIRVTDEQGTISISEDVVSVIAASAAVDVEGVHGLYVSHGKQVTTVDGSKAQRKGVKLSSDNGKLIIDVSIVAKIGYPVSELGAEVQKSVVVAVESATGSKVSEVNVHVCGVALKRSKPAAPAD